MYYVVQGKNLEEHVYRVIKTVGSRITRVITEFKYTDKKVLKDICIDINENGLDPEDIDTEYNKRVSDEDK